MCNKNFAFVKRKKAYSSFSVLHSFCTHFHSLFCEINSWELFWLVQEPKRQVRLRKYSLWSIIRRGVVQAGREGDIDGIM